jgi:hypothetical protein
MAIKKLWVEEYRPSTFDEYIFQNSERRKMASNNTKYNKD